MQFKAMRCRERLKPGIIYGPVHSRRLGCSLGINILPARLKVCSFNCCYCQCGWTTLKWEELTQAGLFPSAKEICNRLEEYLKGAQKDKHIDYLTLSGNGEPTLHPNLEEIIQGILRLRDIYTKDTKVAILSNSSMVTISKVRSALNMLDLRVMKLDAGTQAKFKEVNGPLNNISLDQIIEGLKVLDDLTVQSMFIKGEVENIGERDIYEWSEQIKEISPRYLQIYTIDRPPANPRIKRVEQEILGDIAGVIRKKSGAQIRVYA